MENKKEILAVIVSYNPDDRIIRCYNSIKKQADKVIIVDNFSQEEKSKQYLKQLSMETEIIYNDKNYGIAKALNQVAKYAMVNNYKWLLTADQDSEFLPNTYSTMLNFYEEMSDKEETMLIAPKFKKRIEYEEQNALVINDINWQQETLIITSGSLIKTEIFKQIGFFEEKLFIDRVDFDFCFRININGFITKVAKNLFFICEFAKEEKKHSFTVTNYSSQRRYYITKNTVYLLKYFFKFPKEILYLTINDCFLPLFIILFFETDKFNKIKNIFSGFIDGILNRY